mmetsp:Transcript_6329/g.11575  ORF Transcript_6329/g.11575 Transcript_6329/m.11575 type:complete len:212 (+) Transcript_6329:387-1022(+)
MSAATLSAAKPSARVPGDTFELSATATKLNPPPMFFAARAAAMPATSLATSPAPPAPLPSFVVIKRSASESLSPSRAQPNAQPSSEPRLPRRNPGTSGPAPFTIARRFVPIRSRGVETVTRNVCTTFSSARSTEAEASPKDKLTSTAPQSIVATGPVSALPTLVCLAIASPAAPKPASVASKGSPDIAAAAPSLTPWPLLENVQEYPVAAS